MKKLIRFCDVIAMLLWTIAIILQLVLAYKNGCSPLSAAVMIATSAALLAAVIRGTKKGSSVE